MKTSQPFWQNLLNRFLSIQLFIFLFLILSLKAEAKVGVLEALQAIVRNENAQMRDLFILAEKNVKIFDDLRSSSSLKIHPLYLRSIILNSDPKFIEISKKDQCRFYSLLENSLLKTSLGSIRSVIITYDELNKKKPKDAPTDYIPKMVTQVGLLTVDDFLKIKYDLKCSNQKDLAELFTLKNIIKTTRRFKFIAPKVESDCEAILNDWSDNIYLPYLCNLSNKVRSGESAKQKKASLKVGEIRLKRQLNRQISLGNKYKALMSYYQLSYIENVCSNINSPKRFCGRYLAKDVWTKVISGAKPKYVMKYKCQLILKKKNLEKSDYLKCARLLLARRELCETKGSKEFPSIFPRPNCSDTSKALIKSRLITKFQDCPGYLNNEGIIISFRLVMHQEDDKLQFHADRCMDASLENYYNLSNSGFKKWPMKICYLNKFQAKEECKNYFPGGSGHPDSEGRVIGKIIETYYAGALNTRCTFIETKKFNPKRLVYKSGCFLVFDAQKCTSFSCPKKVIHDQKEITDIRYKGKITFDLIPNSFKNEFQSMGYLLGRKYKSPLKSLKNLTQISFFMNNKSNNIAYGIACIDDLLPHIYTDNSLNSCTPMPFIVDGIIKEKGNSYFVIRLAIDDIHSPRILNWNLVFNGVRSYQEKHPLNLWAFYGFSKN